MNALNWANFSMSLVYFSAYLILQIKNLRVFNLNEFSRATKIVFVIDFIYFTLWPVSFFTQEMALFGGKSSQTVQIFLQIIYLSNVGSVFSFQAFTVYRIISLMRHEDVAQFAKVQQRINYERNIVITLASFCLIIFIWTGSSIISSNLENFK